MTSMNIPTTISVSYLSSVDLLDVREDRTARFRPFKRNRPNIPETPETPTKEQQSSPTDRVKKSDISPVLLGMYMINW